jgi:hypothetical protein
MPAIIAGINNGWAIQEITWAKIRKDLENVITGALGACIASAIIRKRFFEGNLQVEAWYNSPGAIMNSGNLVGAFSVLLDNYSSQTFKPSLQFAQMSMFLRLVISSRRNCL